MEKPDRMKLAESLCSRITEKDPNGILVGGVYGSAARGTDTRWSDLDLLFVVRDKSTLKSKNSLYRSTVVGMNVIKESELLETLGGPKAGWPFWMGVLSVLKVVCGDPKRVDGWISRGLKAPESGFKKTLEEELPGLVFESAGRILSCKERRNSKALRVSITETLLEAERALCLLNRRWVTHDYFDGLVESFVFEKLPDRYRDLVLGLWDEGDYEKAARLAGKLLENFMKLLEREGITLKNAEKIEDIEI